jgi:hypothetical protein
MNKEVDRTERRKFHGASTGAARQHPSMAAPGGRRGGLRLGNTTIERPASRWRRLIGGYGDPEMKTYWIVRRVRWGPVQSDAAGHRRPARGRPVRWQSWPPRWYRPTALYQHLVALKRVGLVELAQGPRARTTGDAIPTGCPPDPLGTRATPRTEPPSDGSSGEGDGHEGRQGLRVGF